MPNLLSRLLDPGRRPLEPLARVAVTLALCLMGLGVLMVYSASSANAGLRFDDSTLFLRRQLVWALLGVATLFLSMRLDPARVERWARPLALLTLVLLLCVLVPGLGTAANGARRWFRVGPFSFQPSELAKLTLVLWLASHLARSAGNLDDWRRGVLPAVAPVAAACALVLVEPDFGTALFLGAICAATMLVGGVPVRKLALCAVAALPLAAWQVVARWEVVSRRFEVLGGTDARSDAVHQVRQSLIALGSGGLTGVGVGAGRQKLLYLPEAHTDFILPVVGEELGFLGTGTVVLVFAAFVLVGLRIVLGCAVRDRFSFLLAFGIVFCVGLQAAGNIAVVTGSVPTKGIALPFLSLGGSSLLVLCASLGLLYGAARRADAGRTAEPLDDERGAAVPAALAGGAA